MPSGPGPGSQTWNSLPFRWPILVFNMRKSAGRSYYHYHSPDRVMFGAYRGSVHVMFTYQYLLPSRADFEEKISTPFEFPKISQLTESALAKLLKGPVGTRNQVLVDVIEPEALKMENCSLADHSLLGNDKITHTKYMTDPEPTDVLPLTDQKPAHKKHIHTCRNQSRRKISRSRCDYAQMRKHHEPAMATCLCRRHACVYNARRVLFSAVVM